MTSDLDIYRTAKLLIDQDGAEAGLRAAERADESLERGELDGAAVWCRIRRAIEELGRTKRGGQ